MQQVLGLRNLVDLLVLLLAVWRLSYMFVWEDGPFSIFRNFREAAGVRYDIEGYRIVITDESDDPVKYLVASVLNCIYCCSVWFSLFFFALYLLFPIIAVALAVPFSLSTGAIVVNRVCDNDG